MKLLIAFFACAFALTAHNEQIIRRINADPTSTWTAGKGPFSDWSVEQMRDLLGAHLPMEVEEQVAPRTPANLPEKFDAREQWPSCIGAVRDQAHCGSCWAFAGAGVLGDRFCIAGCDHGILSPQDAVSCDTSNYGCDGGILANQWNWMTRKGLTTDECLPYVSGGGQVPKCPTQCADGSAIERYPAKSYSRISAKDMQQDMFQYGSQEVAFDVYEDFMHYSSGVYQHKTGSYLGGHAVKAIGWGVENGVDYWLIQNSWNTSWGDKGYFKIRRGTNECRIESQTYAGGKC